jgi:hypothetical protein
VPRFKVAHIREQGIDLIITPLDDNFGLKSESDQQDIIDELRTRAAAAGLRGTVVPVWDGGGRMHFIAPQNWHPFFRSLNMGTVLRNINREIYW